MFEHGRFFFLDAHHWRAIGILVGLSFVWGAVRQVFLNLVGWRGEAVAKVDGQGHAPSPRGLSNPSHRR